MPRLAGSPAVFLLISHATSCDNIASDVEEHPFAVSGVVFNPHSDVVTLDGVEGIRSYGVNLWYADSVMHWIMMRSFLYVCVGI